MTSSEIPDMYAHIQLLWGADRNKYGLRLLLNEPAAVFFVGCVKTQRCRDNFAHLVEDESVGKPVFKCRTCGHVYPLIEDEAVLVFDEDENLQYGERTVEWISNWTGISKEYIAISVT